MITFAIGRKRAALIILCAFALFHVPAAFPQSPKGKLNLHLEIIGTNNPGSLKITVTLSNTSTEILEFDTLSSGLYSPIEFLLWNTSGVLLNQKRIYSSSEPRSFSKVPMRFASHQEKRLTNTLNGYHNAENKWFELTNGAYLVEATLLCRPKLQKKDFDPVVLGSNRRPFQISSK